MTAVADVPSPAGSTVGQGGASGADGRGGPGPGGAVGQGRERRLAGRYRLLRPIASGGMAQVWEATDEVLTRPVAVKLLHPHLAADTSFVARFRAEAINAARLAHPAIVSIYDTYSEDGAEAIIMELVRGTTLRHLLDHRGALDPPEAVTVAAHIAAALEAAHQAGIVHRDIKPANVLLSSDGRVLVTDFGIAKATEGADLTTERTMLGTAKYLAPEQVEGDRVDGRTDLYALGVVLYEMLCGQPPFAAESEAGTALARLHRSPDPPRARRPGLAPSLEAIVMRCLEREPDRRYRDAGALRAALASADTRLQPGADPGVDPEGSSRDATAAGDRAAGAADAGQTQTGPAFERAARPDPEPDTELVTPGARSATGHRRRRHHPGRWLVGALVLAAVGVAAVLATGIGDRAQGRGTADPRGGPVGITAAEAFDPLGNPPGEENNAAAALAVDGDPATAWRTEKYKDPDRMGKPGVGLLVRLERVVALDRVTVTSSSKGWAADLYVVEGPTGPDLDSWGPAVASARDLAPGPARFQLDGRQGSAVLVWVTRTGDDGVVEISEVAVTSR